MSIDSKTLSFLEALNRDVTMQEDLGRALAGATNRLDATVAFAADRGFQASAAGLDEARRAFVRSTELGDAELDAVAGGFNPQPEPPRDLSRLSGKLFGSKLLGW